MCRVGTHYVKRATFRVAKNTDKAFAEKMENRVEIQIQYQNRSLSAGLKPKGKWFDVRLMHSKNRQSGDLASDRGEPDWPTGRIDRHYLGYCIGEHCYNRFSINKTISGMGTLKDIIQSWAKYYLF